MKKKTATSLKRIRSSPTAKEQQGAPKSSQTNPKFKTINSTKYEVLPNGALIGEGGSSGMGWHQIESFLRCPKEYQYEHLRKLRVPQSVTPAPFAEGTMVHAGRARWLAMGSPTMSDIVWAMIDTTMRKAAEAERLPVTVHAEQAARRYMTGYINHYSVLPKPKVIAAEWKLGPVAVGTRPTKANVPVDDEDTLRTARLDDISYYPEAAGKLCIGECKTTSESVQAVVKQYTLHGQTMMQALLWELDPYGEKKFGPIAGIMLDVVVKSSSPAQLPSFGRQFLPITRHQLSWYRETLAMYLRSAKQLDRSSDAPRNVSACTRAVGRGRMACTFADLCRYGASAANRYVVGEGAEAKPLKAWADENPGEVKPWL